MNATRHKKRIVLTFGSVETQILQRAFHSILGHYQVAPEQLDPAIADAWYSTRGCRAVRMSEAETREWRQGLHEFKSARVTLIQSWTEQLAADTAAKPGQRQLQLTLEESATLISVLNDHRLFLAAKHEIGQAEMDLHSLATLHELKPARQFALYEIHLLGWIMEEVLRLTAPEAANWMES